MNTLNIVRSNQNAVMMRFPESASNPSGAALYAIYDTQLQEFLYQGTLNACKKAWNRHYANSRQYVSPNGVNHRYMGQ